MDLIRATDAASKRVVQAAKTLDGYDNFISRVGLNNDNTMSAGTYEFNLVTRNRVLLEAAYRGSWIVGQVIDCIPEDMTRAGISIETTESEEDIDIVRNAMTKLSVMQSFCDGKKWGGLYGGAIGVLQIRGQDLASPLIMDTVREGQFEGIVVFDRWQLTPDLTHVIQNGPNMGMPAYYDIVTSSASMTPVPATMSGRIRVHHSRIIRFGGIKLPFFQAITEQMWDESVLERMWDRLIAFDNATMSMAQLVDRANLRRIGIVGLREIIAAGGDAQKGLEASFEMLRQYQVNEGLTLTDSEDSYDAPSYTFTGLPDVILQLGQQLAGASTIPLLRLFSQSPAGLNADGDADIRMYYDSIKARQERDFRAPMHTVLSVLWRSTLGRPAPKDMGFEFTPLWQNTEKDKADIGKIKTDTVAVAFSEALINQKTAMQELKGISDETGLFNNITQEDIDQADSDPPEIPGEDTGGDGTNPFGDGPPKPDGDPEGDVDEEVDKTVVDKKWQRWFDRIFRRAA